MSLGYHHEDEMRQNWLIAPERKQRPAGRVYVMVALVPRICAWDVVPELV